jgi:hypothetical protein
MSKKDAKQFLEILKKDSAFQFQIANSRNEAECLKAIKEHHLQFDEKEFRGAFEEKYHHPFSKEELHKLTTAGQMSSAVAAKLPYTQNHPHHGE